MIFSKEVGESLTYKFAQAANEMRARGREIISLGLGEPDFETPQYVKDATIKAMNDGFTHYSATQGLPDLRKCIANDYNQNHGCDYSLNNIIVTPGIKAAVYFALCSVLEPDDEIIMISPYYVSYPAMVKLAEPNANIIYVSLRKDFTLDIDTLIKAFNPKTKAILVNTPHNPTGMMLSKNETDVIVELAKKYNAFIIADEVYEKLVYPNNIHYSFADYHEAKDLVIICNGYSKSHAMTGWRLGFAIGPENVIKRMNKLQQHINTNTCTFIQKGACSIYENEPNHIAPYVRVLENRIDYFHRETNSLNYMNGFAPKAGFFYFVDISKTGLDSNTFCSRLLKATGIASTPGLAFGQEWDDHVRFSIAVPKSTLERAIALMKDFNYINDIEL